jgi:hypothetical protein
MRESSPEAPDERLFSETSDKEFEFEWNVTANPRKKIKVMQRNLVVKTSRGDTSMK